MIRRIPFVVAGFSLVDAVQTLWTRTMSPRPWRGGAPLNAVASEARLDIADPHRR